jgi:HlyD family secretion protein
MEVWAAVDEADVGAIKIGQDVAFTLVSKPGLVYRGKVMPQGKSPFRIARNEKGVTYTVVVSVDDKDGALQPHMTANLAFIVADKENALLVPTA